MEVRRVLFRAAKENGRPGKFLQSADASRGHLLRPLVLAGPVALHMRGGIVMRKIAGSERLDPHAVDRPFDAERLGEVGDRGFRRDRKSVVSGKGVAVGVDLGGGRILKKKNKTN